MPRRARRWPGARGGEFGQPAAGLRRAVQGDEGGAGADQAPRYARQGPRQGGRHHDQAADLARQRAGRRAAGHARRPGHRRRAARSCRTEGCDIFLVAGASAIVDRHDVVPAGIEEAGGEVIHFGMPVDPGNLLLTAKLDGKPVLGLPGCAKSPKYNGFDMVLERLAAGLPVGRAEIVRMGAGGLLAEIAEPPAAARRQRRRGARARSRRRASPCWCWPPAARRAWAGPTRCWPMPTASRWSCMPSRRRSPRRPSRSWSCWATWRTR